jgi:hypothetical protein
LDADLRNDIIIRSYPRPVSWPSSGVEAKFAAERGQGLDECPATSSPLGSRLIPGETVSAFLNYFYLFC